MRTALFAALVVAATAFDPGSAAAQAPAANVARAKDLYQAAEAAMTAGRYEDAIRDYGAAYEAVKDPALFYKLGRANERAGHCDAALTYYRRYLAEGAPDEAFTKLTHERIRACGGDPAARPATEPKPVPAKPAPAPVPPVEPAQPAPAPAAPKPAASILGRHQGPWLLIGGSIVFVTLGSVLAYSANAAERDVEDLYVGLDGQPPAFNSATRERYNDAIDEGERYQTLSIVGFGTAGALAAAAAIWFFLDRDAETVTVTPAVAPGSAGVSTTIRF